MDEGIVILGAGNVAFHLANAFRQSDLPVIQIYNRTGSHLDELLQIADCPGITKLSSIHPNAGLYVLAISDDGIGDLAKQLKQYISRDSIVVHTSGCLGCS